MSQVFVLHSGYGLLTAVAAIDAGLIRPGGRRILVAANTSRVPETAPDLDDVAHLRALLDRFDEVVSLGDLLAPVAPARWQPRPEDRPALERLLRAAWRLGDGEVDLYVQSIQVTPAKAFVEIFPSARLTVIGDGLMTYSPIRDRMPYPHTSRIASVVYADVVPGVAPVLFTETSASRVPVPASRFASALAEAAADAADPSVDALADGTPTALVLGQYLASLGLVTEEEEDELQRRMLERALAWGPERIVFKPHPSAPPRMTAALGAYAAAHGIAFVEYRGELPAELIALRLDAVGAVAGFSTALPTLQAIADIPIAAVGTAELLARLQPYENSNRVPLVIVDALTRTDAAWRDPVRLQHLVDTVGYAMQPRIMAHLRPRAVALLQDLDPVERERYVPPARLAELDLPGAPSRSAWARLTGARGGRVEQLRLTARGAKRRTTRAWKELRG